MATNIFGNSQPAINPGGFMSGTAPKAPAGFNPVGAAGGLLSSLFKAPAAAPSAPTQAQFASSFPTASALLSTPTSFGVRAATPSANQSTPSTTLTAKQKAPASQQPIAAVPATQPQPQQTAAATGPAPLPSSIQGNAVIPQAPAAQGTPGSATNLGPGANGTQPQNPQVFTTPNGTQVDAAGNVIGGSQQPQGPSFQGLLGQLLSQGSQYQPMIDKTAQNIAQIRQQAAAQEGGYGTGGLTLPVAMGRQQVLAGTEAQQESALQGQLANQLQGQSLSQSALGNAVSAAQPQLGQYGQTYYQPTQGGASAGSQGVSPSDPFYSTLQTYAQGMADNSLNPSQIPSTISGNPVLQAQLIQMASTLNPSFNPNQWQANTQAQQSNLAQTQQQSQATQQAVTYANSLLDDLTSAYSGLSGLQTTPIPGINGLATSISSATGLGSGATTAYQSTLGEARAAVTQALSSSGGIGVDQAGNVANSLLPNNANPSQIAAAKAYLQTFLSQRQSTFTTPPPAAQYGGGSQGQTSNLTGSLYAF